MKITKLGHACLLVEENGARILIDPGVFSKGFEELRELDAVFVTHQHADHITPENLAKVRENNPDTEVYADAGTAKMFAEKGDAAIKSVKAGDEFEVTGVKVRVYGKDHAVIHESFPGIENVGFMLAGRLFVPGDAFTVPGVPVELLGLPLGAPWLKVGEVVDYVLAVKPKVAIPIHDAVLAMPAMNSDIVQRFTQPQGIEVRVLGNGQTTEV